MAVRPKMEQTVFITKGFRTGVGAAKQGDFLRAY